MVPETRQLRYFVAVAEELHFRRAAERLFVTQPALSHQIARLEEQIGVKLFERDRRRVALTEAGEAFLAGARGTLERAERAVRDAQRAGGTGVERLALGYVEYATFPFIPPAVAALRGLRPGIRIERHEMTPARQEEALLEGRIDVAFRALPVSDPALDSVPLLRGRWLVVLPDAHPLADGEEVPGSSLAGEPLVLFSRGINPANYDDLIGRCRRAGFKPEVVYETAQPQVGPSLVAEGLGLFLVASYVPVALPDGVVSRPLAGFGPEIEVGAVFRRGDRTPPLRDFLGLLSSESAPSNADRLALRAASTS